MKQSEKIRTTCQSKIIKSNIPAVAFRPSRTAENKNSESILSGASSK